MTQEEKILVTGGTGFLGSYIIRELLHQGYTNIHAIRRKDSDRRLVHDLEDQISWWVTDLDQVDEIYDSISGAHTVIHAAGLVSFIPRDRDQLYQINADGTGTVVNACLEHGVKRLIHISSSSALAKIKDGSPITEKTKWVDDKHISVYGRSKRLAEIEIWRGIAEGLDAIILNPTIILGAGIWESTSCKLFFQVFQGLKYYPPGSTGFVDVRDVARIAVDMIHHPQVNQSYIINGSNLSFRKLFTQIAEGLGVTPPLRLAPRWIARFLVAVEFIKSKLTGKRPIVTSETIRNSYQNFSYSNDKIRGLGYDFIPIEDTIQDTTAALLAAAQNNFEPGLLAPRNQVKPKS